MKKIYVEARRKFDEDEINFSALDALPKGSVSLAATIQYIGLLNPVKKYLEDSKRKVSVKKGAWHKGHILGCNPVAFDKSADILLLIADGKFHALNNAIQLQREIYIFTTKSLEILGKGEIERHNGLTRAKQSKFLKAKKVGLLYSTKDGQKFGAIENLKKIIEKGGKKAFIFEADNLPINGLEAFPQIEIWVNTACYGLARDDKRIVNLKDIIQFLNL